MSTNPTPLKQFTAIIEREDDGFVALCPELDLASQGDTIEEARRNLQEAVELFLEAADPSEVYVRAKIAEGETAIAEGRTVPHGEVVKRFATR